MLVIACVAFALTIPALINGFPFVFMDTIDYIILTPRLYRSPFYQIFVFVAGLKRSAWLPILVQAALSATILWYLLEDVTGRNLRRFLLAGMTIAIFSSLSIFTGFLMPDVFTGLMFAGLFILATQWPAISNISRVLLTAITLLSILVHLSHLVMAVAILLVGVVGRMAGARMLNWRGLGAGIACTLAAVILYVGYNAAVFGKATISPAGSTFLMANLIEYGPARRELRQGCPASGYRICRYAEQLPPTANELLWKEGALSALGGFEGMKTESDQIVVATIQHRPGDVAAVSAANTLRALARVKPTTDVVAFADQAKVGGIIQDVYGRSARQAFASSLQEMNRFPRTLFDGLTIGGLTAALVAIIAGGALTIRRARWDLLVLPAFSMVAYAGNALTCATLSGVFDRYQSRVSWLIVAAAIHLWLGIRHDRSIATHV